MSEMQFNKSVMNQVLNLSILILCIIDGLESGHLIIVVTRENVQETIYN